MLAPSRQVKTSSRQAKHVLEEVRREVKQQLSRVEEIPFSCYQPLKAVVRSLFNLILSKRDLFQLSLRGS